LLTAAIYIYQNIRLMSPCSKCNNCWRYCCAFGRRGECTAWNCHSR